ncbi:MAG: Helix-turn-helix domain [Chlamydiales bacterium]|jgi:transcriptional regulator with XRE-family HTH domain|nr:Helix-turn-helix domain [Chlamydiales bacterium]
MSLRLREVRMARHQSQLTLGKSTGISRSYISEMENGRYDPTTGTICRLCKALNCTPNDLIDCGDE